MRTERGTRDSGLGEIKPFRVPRPASRIPAPDALP